MFTTSNAEFSDTTGNKTESLKFSGFHENKTKKTKNKPKTKWNDKNKKIFNRVPPEKVFIRLVQTGVN